MLDIGIVGSGIAGLTSAAGLSAAGHRVTVYERSETHRAEGAAISLMTNALQALARIQLPLELPDDGATTFESLTFCTARGRPIRTLDFSPQVARSGQPNLAISRSVLHTALRNQCRDVSFRLGETAAAVVEGNDGAIVHTASGGSTGHDLVVGADGIGSVVRSGLETPDAPYRYSGYLCWRALAPYPLNRVPNGFARHYWGLGQRFGLARIGGGMVYWWGTLNVPEQSASAYVDTNHLLSSVFDGWAPEVIDVIERTDTESVSTILEYDRPVAERWASKRTVLVGDAAHPMVSSMGQGAGLAVEDAATLVYCLGNQQDLGQALSTYVTIREPRARAMAGASWSLSRIEQSQRRSSCLAREVYFRCAPERIFRERNDQSLMLSEWVAS